MRLKCSIGILGIVILGLANVVLGAEQCPAIDCDCTSLPNDNWVSACKSHEARIKKECVANLNTPKDYCSISGLNAKPLPLSLEFSEFQLDENTDIRQIEEKVASLYWAVQLDSGQAKDTFESGNFARTMQILKLVDSNIANLFEQQQKIEAAWRAQSKGEKSIAAWKKYSKDTYDYAKTLRDFGRDIAANIDTADSKKDKKIYTVLSRQALRMAGKGYEHAGFAFGKANRHKRAALAWKDAAQVSRVLSDIVKKSNGDTNAIKFAEYQAAARLHRASFHYLSDGKVKDLKSTLKASQLFVNRDEQRNIEALLNPQVDESDNSELSGR